MLIEWLRHHLTPWLVREHWAIGASLARVALGSWAVYFYLLHFRVRHVLWGPDGLWPFETFVRGEMFFSIFRLSRAPLFFEVVYLAGLVVAVTFTLGVWPRLTGTLHWLMIWSLQERNPLITDGGDNIMRIALLFLIFANTGAHFALPTWRVRVRLSDPWARIAAAMHNLAILLVLTQLSMLYMSTGLYKAMGELWQNGTALYYILRVDEFSWPTGAALVYRNPYLVVLGTYGTVLFEVAFFPCLFNRWTRYATVAAGVVFHAGIAVFMGLVTFAWSMLSLYPLLFTDQEYEGGAAGVRRRFGLTILYDGWCPMCVRSIRWMRALDLFTLIRFVSFREPGVLDQYGLDPRTAGRRMLGFSRGRTSEGMDTLLAIAVRSVPLWPATPILWLVKKLAGQRVYDFLASRRLIVPPGVCDASCSAGAGRWEDC